MQEADIPIFLSKLKQFRNKLIAGRYNGLQGKISTESELLIIWGTANSRGTQVLDIPKQFELNISAYGKVVHHGPYVMNSETEIPEAMRDYQKGKMVVLIEEE